MALLEPWRSRYLEALGVEQWVAKRPLSNAAASVVPAWEPIATAPEPPGNELAAPTAPMLVERRALRIDEPVVVRRDAVEPAPAAETASRKVVRFSLLMVRFGHDLMIIDGSEGHHEMNDYLRLASQVGRAIGADTSSVAHDVFRWPIAHHPKVATDRIAASEALTGCLIQQLQGDAQRLLILGDEAQRWITPGVLAPLDGCRMAAGPSLWHCLATGKAKRSLWEALVRAGFTTLH